LSLLFSWFTHIVVNELLTLVHEAFVVRFIIVAHTQKTATHYPTIEIISHHIYISNQHLFSETLFLPLFRKHLPIPTSRLPPPPLLPPQQPKQEHLRVLYVNYGSRN